VSTYSEYFLNSKASIVQLECLEISHTNFSQTWRLVRNAVKGVTVIHEDSEEHDYIYYPMNLQLSGPRDDLDHILRVVLGDVGSIVSQEMERVRIGDGGSEFPQCVYRTYRSDNLTTPLYGPLFLTIKKVNMSPEGAQFEAKAPSLNANKTGEKYDIARFPMLRGLL